MSARDVRFERATLSWWNCQNLGFSPQTQFQQQWVFVAEYETTNNKILMMALCLFDNICDVFEVMGSNETFDV